jgi:hypothetical protein
MFRFWLIMPVALSGTIAQYGFTGDWLLLVLLTFWLAFVSCFCAGSLQNLIFTFKSKAAAEKNCRSPPPGLTRAAVPSRKDYLC